jgi:putative endonuclease
VKNYWVYLLRCSDSKFYAGITGNIDARLYQHNNGLDGPKAFTYKRRPVTLVFAALYYDVNQAIAFETQVKGWSHAKKEALTRGDFEEIRRLARNYTQFLRGQGDRRSRASTGSA